MKRTIELNSHNRNKVKIVDLIIGICFTSFSIINSISLIGENLDYLDILGLIVFPIAGTIWLLSGLGYNWTRFLKQERLIIDEKTIVHEGFFAKTIISPEQIQSIERKNKTVIFKLGFDQQIKIHLSQWDDDKINEHREPLLVFDVFVCG